MLSGERVSLREGDNVRGKAKERRGERVSLREGDNVRGKAKERREGGAEGIQEEKKAGSKGKREGVGGIWIER